MAEPCCVLHHVVQIGFGEWLVRIQGVLGLFIWKEFFAAIFEERKSQIHSTASSNVRAQTPERK